RPPSRGRPSRSVQSTRPSSRTAARTPSSVYQPPPQKKRGARSCARIHSASRRTRSAGSPPVGRAWVGLVQCVCSPNGARACAARARVSQRCSSSPSATSGGRISAITSNPPGRRRCNASNRSQTSSRSGCSRWQETIAAGGLGTLLRMCGICGLYSPSGEPQPALVDAMRARIRHRGPDQGSSDAFGPCVLGHQRLQVIDPELGYQPVASERGDVVAVFNGELYNFPELRRELAERGHDVRGRGDTPVIPHLYEEYGPTFVERLDGMFAIALWDAGRNRLGLERVRDTAPPPVRSRPAADVPPGALLSGGIDSAVVVALMAAAAAEPVRTFTVGFADDRYDERTYARSVAARYGTRHEEIVL